MEPVHGGRDDLNLAAEMMGLEVAAMEPVHGGRDDLAMRTTNRPNARRNGARPRRTGRLGATPTRVLDADEPQWSPSTEDGTTAS